MHPTDIPCPSSLDEMFDLVVQILRERPGTLFYSQDDGNPKHIGWVLQANDWSYRYWFGVEREAMPRLTRYLDYRKAIKHRWETSEGRRSLTELIRKEAQTPEDPHTLWEVLSS
jgi:hypothetical protein